MARTRVIAHRGASGYLPEHTLAAKAFGFALGCDFIEQDVVATRDEKLVVLHDHWLDDVSDVAAVFAGQAREDGRHYVADFTFAELGQLRLAERRRRGEATLQFPSRYPYASDQFRIVAFEDEVRFISGLNASTGRHVGIYPEIKEPAWHAAQGLDVTGLLHAALEAARDVLSGPVFVQSFDAAALIRLRDEFDSAWPRVRLLDDDDVDVLNANPDAITAISDYAVGVGLPYTALIASGEGAPAPSALAARLEDSGLLVHPYTMRRDVAPPGGLSYQATLRFLIHAIGVDGLFCDHPDDAIAIRDGTAA